MGVIINDFEIIVEQDAVQSEEKSPAQTEEQMVQKDKPMDIQAILIHESRRELRVTAH